MIALLLARPIVAWGGDFVWQHHNEQWWGNRPEKFDWSVADGWKAKNPGDRKPPRTSADTGEMPAGTVAFGYSDLGSPNNRPTITIDRDAELVMPGGEHHVPLVLNGGRLELDWKGQNLEGPIKVVADSSISNRWEHDGQPPRDHIVAPLMIDAGATLTLDGDIALLGDNSKTAHGQLLYQARTHRASPANRATTIWAMPR